MKRIKWQYTHWFNSRSSVQRVKEGDYFAKVKHTVKHWKKRGAVQLAWVRFDGNKRCSRVPVAELKFIKALKDER